MSQDEKIFMFCILQVRVTKKETNVTEHHGRNAGLKEVPENQNEKGQGFLKLVSVSMKIQGAQGSNVLFDHPLRDTETIEEVCSI